MVKNKITPGTYLFPMPVVLVGALVDGKPNFMPLAWVSIAENKPPMISISMAKSHHTNKGIVEHNVFSVNIPSGEMIVKLDYCGLISGKNTDKSEIFEVFYGDLETAPMIKDAPVNLECKVINNTNIVKGHEIYTGEIINAYANDEYLTNGKPDIKKVKPIIYATGTKNYWKVGDLIGKAWSIGKSYTEKD